MTALLNRVEETVAYIQNKTGKKPETAIVLGSGLGQLADKLEDAVVIPYEELPHWKSSTAPGHNGIKERTSFCKRVTAAVYSLAP